MCVICVLQKLHRKEHVETLNQELDQVKEVLKIGSFGRGVTIELESDIYKLKNKTIELKQKVIDCFKKYRSTEINELNELFHVIRVFYNGIQFDISVIPDINVNYNLKKQAENQISLQNLLSSLQFKQMIPKLKHETKCKTLIRLAKYWSKYNKPKPKLLSIFTEHLMHQIYDNHYKDRGYNYLM